MNPFSSYRMEEASRDQMAAADPFGGNGIFLAAPHLENEEIIDALETRLRMIIPAVAWGGIGAWVDQGSIGMSAARVRALWDGGEAGDHG